MASTFLRFFAVALRPNAGHGLHILEVFCCGTATQRESWPPHPWGFLLWHCDPTRVMASTFFMASTFLRFFLDHTQWRSTVGKTPLDEWSARRRDLYLTAHNTHNRQISIPPVGFEPTISVGERPQTYASDRAATGILSHCTYAPIILKLITLEGNTLHNLEITSYSCIKILITLQKVSN
jgi:hypothetical protein